jgi:hypothetical protein
MPLMGMHLLAMPWSVRRPLPGYKTSCSKLTYFFKNKGRTSKRHHHRSTKLAQSFLLPKPPPHTTEARIFSTNFNPFSCSKLTQSFLLPKPRERIGHLRPFLFQFFITFSSWLLSNPKGGCYQNSEARSTSRCTSGFSSFRGSQLLDLQKINRQK